VNISYILFFGKLAMNNLNFITEIFINK
jgi:hypothetical protein